ncbi:MAG: S41 family peptidase, partial [Chitinispirillaceae bacterium]|nr:S41 family peptidase [Chitinispirillaceae bacterium]
MANSFNRSLSRMLQKPPIVGVAVLFVVVMGIWIDVPTAKGDSDNFYSDIIRFENVATKIHQNYVEDMQSDELIDNGIKGLLRTLDPHTSYFKRDQYEELKIHTEGKFGGLGIQISIRNKVLTVMTPISGTPAARAGIQSGDQIITIDGKSTAGITIDKAVSKLRGEPGTRVTIMIRRKGEAKDMEYTITREIIRIKPVPFAGVIDSAIGYVHLTQFSQDAGAEVEKALQKLLKNKIRGLILDLRHNPGGLLPQAIDVADKFLQKKRLVVSTRGRTLEQNKEFYSRSGSVLPEDMPLVVLVNYASASASEIVAGAIQDWDRGVIVGDTTFGKGSVQSVFPLDKKHHLKMTTAFYYTPSGRCINRQENAVRGAANGDDDDGDEQGAEDGEENDDGTTVEKSKAVADTTIYRTKGGRKMFGGGGIIPDTIVKQKIPNMVIRTLFGKDLFFRFANIEYVRLKKRDLLKGGDIAVSPRIMKDFYRFLDSLDFTYQSLSQARFDDFKRAVDLLKDTAADTARKRVVLPGEKPKWVGTELSSLQKTVGELDTLLTRESRRAVAENEA